MSQWNQRGTGFLGKRKWFIVAGVAAGLVAALVIGSNYFLGDFVRQEVIALLEEKYGSDVEFASLSINVFPAIRVSGEGFVLRHKGRTDVPPLIRIGRLSARAAFWELLRSPRHVGYVRLDSLEITVPPRREKAPEPEKDSEKPRRRTTPVVVDELVADRAVVTMLPKESYKDPLVFEIHRLRMESVGLDRPAPFRAALTNPKPPGEIQTEGQFGPWHREDPGATPLAATYRFSKADLGAFRGISGILESKGRFQGVLERIVVDGETNTPDFSVDISGQRVPLHTAFHAIVDGTNGNTLLQPVRARLLRSNILADGGVVKKRGDKGRTVALDVTVENARLEDVMRLAIKGKPPLTGQISFRTKFLLPPGEEAISRKLRLDGQFGIGAARFTDLNVQEKVATLSKKGKGEPEAEIDPGSVISDLRGRFQLREAVITFSDLTFAVPGAKVRLAGSYGLESEQLDFKGALYLQAKPSQTTTGVKSFFLKLVDPIFHDKRKGTVVPIKVSGTRQKPEFGLDAGRIVGDGK